MLNRSLSVSRCVADSQWLAFRTYSWEDKIEEKAYTKTKMANSGTHARSNSSVNNPSRERGKKLLSRVSQPRRLRKEKRREKRYEKRVKEKDGETKRGETMILSRRRRTSTIRKNLLIGDPDLCRAPGSYPRGSSSGVSRRAWPPTPPLRRHPRAIIVDHQRKRNAPPDVSRFTFHRLCPTFV